MSDYQQEQYEDYMARRDQYEYEKLEDDYKNLESKIQSLEAQVELLKNCAEFYASPVSWHNDGTVEYCHDVITILDTDYHHSPVYKYGGKRSRQALDQLSKMRKGEGE